MDFFITAIKSYIDDGLISDPSTLISSLRDNPFGESVYTFTLSLRDNIFMPVAYTLLGLFILMELWRISVRTEGNGGGYSPVDVVMVVLKAVFFKCMIDIAPKLFIAIYDVTTSLSSDVLSTSLDKGAFDTGFTTTLVNEFNDLSFLEQLCPMIFSGIVFVVVAIASYAGTVLLSLRFIEIFVFISVSPAPLATLPSQETSQIGKSFLKTFVAVCFQGVLIAMVSRLGTIIIGNFVSNAEIEGGWTMIKALTQVALGCIVYVLVLFQTSKWSKQVCAAM